MPDVNLLPPEVVLGSIGRDCSYLRHIFEGARGVSRINFDSLAGLGGVILPFGPT